MIELSAPVVEVVVLEDRAQVTRRGVVRVDAGQHTLRLADVAPVLADKTLRAQVTGAVLVDARVTREPRILRADRPERVAELEGRIEALEAQVQALDTRAERLEAERRLLSDIVEQYLDDAMADVSWGHPEPRAWKAQLDRLAQADSSRRVEAVEVRRGQEQLTEQLADLRARRAAATDCSSSLGAAVLVDVATEQAAMVEVELSYVVPCAAWRPLHTAWLQGARVSWTTHACVWQRSGEDWVGVQLKLSTERPSLGTEPPRLADDVLAIRPKAEVVAVEVREQTIESTGLGVKLRQTDGMPGIDDGGEARLLGAEGPSSVPSDGRPYRLVVQRFESPASVDLVAMPEKTAVVVRRCRLENRGPTPLLAGPVELVADSGRVGNTSVLFVSPGEAFELGFGPEPDLRIGRRTEQLDPETSTLSRWVKLGHRVRLNLSNLGSVAHELRVVERIPVSELEQVKVTLDSERTTPPATADDKGYVTWTVMLDPGATRELTLAWTLEKKKDVVGV